MITAFSFIIFVSLQHLVVLFPFVLPFLSLIDLQYVHLCNVFKPLGYYCKTKHLNSHDQHAPSNNLFR